MPNDLNGLERVARVLETLLGPQGCPWDQAQTPESLCEYLLEESYELVDAVRSGRTDHVREELGDVMFILLFFAKLYKSRGDFTLDEALEANAEKMMRRHPHVFADSTFVNREELMQNWERIKRAEKKDKAAGIFAELPEGLPPLLKAYRLHSKSARANFTWDSDEDAEQQVEAEWLEWLDACAQDDARLKEHELGDLLFSIVELGRRHGIKASAALAKTNARFLRRFAAMEALARQERPDCDFAALSQAEKDALWDRIKEQEGPEPDSDSD